MIKGKDINPIGFLGSSVKVFLKSGGSFNYKITGCSPSYLDGYDDESTNITININDIDFIIGGN